MSNPLGLVVVIILVIILLGGIGPHFYAGAPWQPGYGYGTRGIGVLGVILIIFLILWLMGYV